jgi:hypothetical protein
VKYIYGVELTPGYWHVLVTVLTDTNDSVWQSER